MQILIHSLCIAALAGLLVAAAIGDARRFTIPNWLTGSVAALAIPYWLTASGASLPLAGQQLLLALAVFAVLAGLFAAGVMGGGDVKLLAAIALWVPPLPFLRLFTIIAVLGGILTAGILIAHRLRKRGGQPEIPYGIAISAGALAMFGEPLVKHFPG